MKFRIFNHIFSSGGVFVAAMMTANFLNFLFNAILGRTLTLEQFSLITLANTLWLLITVFLNSLAGTTNNRTAYLLGKKGADTAAGFRQFITKKTLLLSGIMAIMWFSLLPVFSNLFHTKDYLLFASITPAISLGIYVAVTRGFFQGTFSFIKAVVIIFVEAVSKLIIGLLFLYWGLGSLAYLSIPLSIAITFFVALFFTSNLPKAEVAHKYLFPKRLLLATFLTVFSSAAFLSIDVLLARHFLSQSQSGAYALLSLVGKMLYFCGSVFGVFILTFASRDTGENKNSAVNFYKILGLVMVVLLSGYIMLGFLGQWIVPLLLGQKSLVILPYLKTYTVAIIFFTIAGSFATYHLAKQQYIFAYNGIVATGLAILGLFFFHRNISEFVYVTLFASFFYLAVNMILHVFYKDISEYVDEEDVQQIADFEKVKGKHLSVSICLPAYNEGKNIKRVVLRLLKQQTRLIHINKIVVVSSASTDKTDEIVEELAQKYSHVKLIREDKRRGKASAINTFLKHVDDPVVVIQSADTIPVKDTIEKLCRPFLVDKHIGMTGGAPIPVNDPNNFLGFVIHTWWWFHRNIPRFGEIIAYRNIIGEVSPRTAVDEAYIQAKFAQLGYKIVYIDEAVVYNKGSENLSDIIKQRRRIFNGHTRLQKEENVHISHLSKSGIKLLLFEYKLYSFWQLVWLTGGMLIEVWANILGRYDKYVNRLNPVVWDVAKSTKDLAAGSKGGIKEKW